MEVLLGEQASVLLASQRVVPAVAQQAGYVFRYPAHEAALRAALGKGG
jgi:NAD dependent epimerase/dehydratase family enzyme